MTRQAQGGKREDLGDRYFRSMWESNYARYLNWLVEHQAIKGWQYEPDTFEFPVKRGTLFYTPDFKVTNLDGSVEYHEVKGYMDPKSQTQLKRMAKYHPQVKVVVIDQQQYRAVAKAVAAMIPTWESKTADDRRQWRGWD